jgi:hypothetical protein
MNMTATSRLAILFSPIQISPRNSTSTCRRVINSLSTDLMTRKLKSLWAMSRRIGLKFLTKSSDSSRISASLRAKTHLKSARVSSHV